MLKYNVENHQALIDGVNLTKLAQEYQTPLYVISYSKLKENMSNFKKHFLDKYENVSVHYACKANISVGLAQIMQANGFGLDVVSKGEIFIAKAANVNMKNIEFNGNNKTIEDITYGIENEVGYFVVDNELELDRISEIATKLGKVQDILFRITPEVSDGANEKINTGQKDSKFGVPITQDIFMNLLGKALKLEGINVKGIHFHVGSQLFKNNAYLVALDVVLRLAKEMLERYDYQLEVLNIGGGFGITYTENDNPPTLDYYFEPIMEKIETMFKELGYKRPKIVTEPGRYMIGEAGFTLYEVGSIKDIPEVRKYVAVNGGMTDNIRPSMYQAKYEAIVTNKADLANEELVTIAGNCCESGDIVIKDIELPKLETGDILCVFSTGAYGYSMASNYNLNTIPGTVLIEDGKVQWLIKPQTYEQTIQNNVKLDI